MSTDDTLVEITLHMLGDGQFNIICPECGKGKTMHPPAHLNSLRVTHCGKKFLFHFNRRKGLRKKCDESGTLKRKKERIKIQLKDLSLGGISFESKIAILPSDVIELVAFFLIAGDLTNPIRLEIISQRGNLYRAKFQSLPDGYTSKKAIFAWLQK